MPLVTVAQAKSWLGLTTDEEDELIHDLTTAAQAAVEGYAGRGFDVKEVTESLRGTGSSTLFVRRPPIVSISTVTISGTAVTVSNDSLSFWSTTRKFVPTELVIITYTGGFDPVPGDVLLATKMTVQAMYGARVVDPNITSDSMAGLGGGFDQFGPGAVPRAARSLLDNYALRYWQ